MNRSLVASLLPHPAARVAPSLLHRLASSDAYRVIVCVGLVMHFTRRACDLFRTDSSLVLLAVLCALLSSLFVSSSVVTPIAAVAVNVIGVILYRAIPSATLDDYFANLAPLAVAAVWSAEARNSSGRRFMGLGCWIVCAVVLVIYVGGGPFALLVDSSRGPAWIRWAFRSLAVALMAPAAALNGAAVILQVLLHGYLAMTGPDKLVHLLLAASAALFVLRRAQPDSPIRVDLWSVVALSLGVVTLNTYCGARFFATDVSRSARLLAAVGILPLPSERSRTADIDDGAERSGKGVEK